MASFVGLGLILLQHSGQSHLVSVLVSLSWFKSWLDCHHYIFTKRKRMQKENNDKVREYKLKVIFPGGM